MMKKKLFTLLLAVATGVGTMFAWDYEHVQIGDLYYNLDATNHTAEITSQNSVSPYWSTSITKADIPASVTYNAEIYSVTSIGEYAFGSCSGLTSVTIGNSVTSIGNWAFSSCSGLTSVTIPNSVTSIGMGVFGGCSVLNSINVDTDNENYTSKDGVLFSKNQTILVQYPGGKQGSYTVPNSVLEIGAAAFEDCREITAITISNNVKTIGNEAFAHCARLKNVIIPNSVTIMGDYVFSGCENLMSITIGDNVSRIGTYSFHECIRLVSVTIGNSVQSISARAFYECCSLETIIIPNSVTTIGDWAFQDCTGLTSIVVGDGVEYIGYGAFFQCVNLSSVELGEGLRQLREGALGKCNNLNKVTCWAITPPQMLAVEEEVEVFHEIDCSQIPLYVPAESVDLYKAADQWKDFNVQPIPSNYFEGCPDWYDLTGSHVKCEIGPYSARQTGNGWTTQIVDYGPDDIRSRHTVHRDGNEQDARTTNNGTVEGLHTVPAGELASVRLGNWLDGRETGAANETAQAERITYTFRVTEDNKYILLRYAIVWQDPHNHNDIVPSFQLETFLGATGNTLIDGLCYNFDYDAVTTQVDHTNDWDTDCRICAYTRQGTSQGNYYYYYNYRRVEDCPEFTWRHETQLVAWRDWRTRLINLEDYVGQIVRLRFTSSDCGYMEHWGYSYFTLRCLDANLYSPTCGGPTETRTFTAPTGLNYIWYKVNDDPGHTRTELLSESSNTLTVLNDGQMYECYIASPENANCRISLYAKVEPRLPLADFDIDLHEACVDTVYLIDHSGVSRDGVIPLSPHEDVDVVTWDLGDGRTNVTLAPGTPITYAYDGTYSIRQIARLTNGNCVDDSVQTVTVRGRLTKQPCNCSSELQMIKLNGSPIEGFAPDKYTYTFTFPAGTNQSWLPTVANISWIPGDEYQKVTASQVGSSVLITVTSCHGLQQTYVLNFIVGQLNQFTVSTLSSNDAWGTVIGGNTYNAGSVVEIGAFANDGYQFYHWNNTIADNPYAFTLTQDTTFVALFLPNTEEGILAEVTANSVHLEWEVKHWGNHGYWIWVYTDKDHRHWYCKMRVYADGTLDKFYWGPASKHYDGAEPNPVRPRNVLRAPAVYTDEPNVIAYDLNDIDAGVDYYYTFEVVDEFDNVVAVQAGTFSTPPSVPTGVDDVQSDQVQSTKVVRDGKMYIIRGEKVYNVTGQEVK